MGILALGATAPAGALPAIETSTTLTATPNPSSHGQAVTLTAKVRSSGAGTPTGTVTFKNGADTLAPVTFETTVTGDVAAGRQHTCAIVAAGAVKCWGYNGYGQLGDGSTTTPRSTPVDVVGLTGVVAVAGGSFHTCALTAAGTVKCWGYNLAGQLGDHSTINRSTPVDVTGLTGVRAIAAGEDFTCALLEAGGVKCWGENEDGRLGDGTTTDRFTPTDVSGLTGVSAITTGDKHACALTAAGGIKCWGNNGNGRLGDGTTTQRSTPVDVVGLTGAGAVVAGGSHTCAITTAGAAKCWGSNFFNQLGDDTWTDRWTPVDVVGLGSGTAAITAGTGHTCAITNAGGAKCWGWNSSGELGDGTTTGRSTATDVSGLGSGTVAITAGQVHTCAITNAGGLKCWGSNVTGQVGDGSDLARTTPVDVTGLTAALTAKATLTTNTLAVGSHSLTAEYSGDAAHGSSVSAALIQVVNDIVAAPTSVTLNVKPNTAIVGQTVRLTTRVAPRAPATGTPTGTVTFLSGQTVLGTAPLVDGSVVFETTGLGIGTNTLRARYEGSFAFTANNSPQRTVTIDPRIGAALTADRDGEPEQAGDKHYPAVTGLGSGGFVVVWQTAADGGTRVYARLYKPTGEPAGNEFRVGATTGTSQGRPSVARVADGDFVVVWESQGPSGHAVYGQRYRGENLRGGVFLVGNGDAPLGPDRSRARSVAAGSVASANGIVTAIAEPVIAALGDGGFVVVWAADRQDGKGRNVYARRYTADRQPLGAEFRVNPEAANDQWQPSVAALGDGGFVVAWSSNETDPAIIGVYGQRYDAEAKKTGKLFRVMATGQFRSEPSVAGLAGSEFVVAFSALQGNPATTQNIQARQYDAVGARVAITVNTTRNSYQFAPRVASFGAQGFIAVWVLDNASRSEIHARIFNANGGPLSNVFRIDQPTSDFIAAGMPSVAMLPNDRAVIVWRSHDFMVPQTRIQVQRISVKGVQAAP